MVFGEGTLGRFYPAVSLAPSIHISQRVLLFYLLTLTGLAIALAMDAFAVALGAGVLLKPLGGRQLFRLGRKIGSIWGSRVEVLGGGVLIAIGL